MASGIRCGLGPTNLKTLGPTFPVPTDCGSVSKDRGSVESSGSPGIIEPSLTL